MTFSTIRLVLFDVDGVLTDGRLRYGPNGEEIKVFHARDGVGVSMLRMHGIRFGLLSGRSSKAVVLRAEELGFSPVILGTNNKVESYKEIVRTLHLTDLEVAFVGDDVIDLGVMQLVGVSIAPSDAHPIVREGASFVTKSRGGMGVARDVAEYVLSLTGLSIEEMYRPLLVGQQNWPVPQ